MSGIIGLIPARQNSKRIKNKNIRMLGGKPLLMWSIEVSRMIKDIERTIVSTDSSEIAEIVEGHADVIIRPKALASDKSIDIEYILHFIEYYKLHDMILPEYIVLLRPTTPFRTPQIVKDAIGTLQRHANATSLRSVTLLGESAYKSFKIAKKGYLEGILKKEYRDPEYHNWPSQMFPKTYKGDGCVDVLRTDNILKTNTMYGDKMLAMVSPDDTCEIDTELEFNYLEWVISS